MKFHLDPLQMTRKFLSASRSHRAWKSRRRATKGCSFAISWRRANEGLKRRCAHSRGGIAQEQPTRSGPDRIQNPETVKSEFKVSRGHGGVRIHPLVPGGRRRLRPCADQGAGLSRQIAVSWTEGGDHPPPWRVRQARGQGRPRRRRSRDFVPTPRVHLLTN
jgi:hypothetical protein